MKKKFSPPEKKTSCVKEKWDKGVNVRNSN